jgi:AbrB family looped-hinge helix DNA binding protein
MKSRSATMKDKGQITVPAEMRKSHDLDKGTRVIFEDRGDYIALIPTHNLIEELAGSLSEYATDEPLEWDREQLWAEIAAERDERVVQQIRDQDDE